MRRVFWTVVTAMVVCAMVFPEAVPASQRKIGGVTLPLLKLDHGARMSGMAGCFTAIADDIGAIHKNPAGLTHLGNAAYSLSYTRWLTDSKLYSGAVAYKTALGVVGLSVVTFRPEEMEESTIFQPNGTGRNLDINTISIGLAYAKKMTDKLSFGFVARWTQDNLDLDRLTAYDITVGTHFYTGFRSLRLGMAFMNLGKDNVVTGGETQIMPVVFSFAAAGEVFGEQGDPAYLTLTLENYYATDYSEPQYRLGGELWFQNTLAVRGGYKFNYDIETFSMGLGVKFSPAEGRDIRADFAYTKFDYFDAPLRFTLSGSF